MPLQHILQHFFNGGRQARFDLHANNPSAAAALDGAAVIANQILRLFLYFNVAVPEDTENAAVDDLVAREEQSREATQYGFHCHVARGFSGDRSEEHTSELQSLMRISYAVFCLKKKHISTENNHPIAQSCTLGSTTRPDTPTHLNKLIAHIIYS